MWAPICAPFETWGVDCALKQCPGVCVYGPKRGATFLIWPHQAFKGREPTRGPNSGAKRVGKIFPRQNVFHYFSPWPITSKNSSGERLL